MFLKKWCLLLSKRLGILLLVVVAMMLSCGINLADENNCTHNNVNFEKKTFEFPSKLHKDGEGFYEIGKMLTPRFDHSSILLDDGRIFIVGGRKNGNIDGDLKSTEIFDMKTKQSIAGPTLPCEVSKPLLLSLDDGKVIIIGTKPDSEFLIYDPVNNSIIEKVSFHLKYKLNRESAFIVYVNKNEILICNNFISRDNAILYNIRNNTIKYISTEKLSKLGKVQYLFKDKDIVYLLSYSGNLIKLELKNIKNSLQYEYFLDNNNINSFNGSAAIRLQKNLIAVFSAKSIKFFDIENHIYSQSKPLNIDDNNAIILYSKVLENNNVIIIKAQYSLRDFLLEYNPRILKIQNKTYSAPGFHASIIDLGKDCFLYSGGVIPSINPFKYQYDNISNKIYVWKKVKV